MTPATITPPECGLARPIFTEAVALELAKLVGKDWLDVGIHLAHEYDYSVCASGDPDPAVTIVVTIGLPTDGRRFASGRGFTLAEAIRNVRPVCEGGANG